jgi:OOP family OmpA-OmpF porin
MRRGLQWAGAIAVLAAFAPSAFSQVIYVPAPAARYEPPPPPRAGHRWQPGYWDWEHGNYVWRQGGWESGPPGPPPVMEYAPREVVVAPAPPRVERLSTDALFRFDRGDVSDISPTGLSDLAQIAARLQHGRFDHVEIRGYTDRLGTDAYNINLSQRRANAVKTVLVQQGVPPDKIRATGLGKQDPIVQCSQPSGPAAIQCLQPNRRVEIVTYVAHNPYRYGNRGRYAAP